MTYVLDTNIILGNPSLSQYKGEVVYIPIAVMKELDNQKTRDGNVGFKSRLFHRKLKEVNGLEGDSYNFDGVIILNPTEELEGCFENNITIADDWFVSSKILNNDDYIAHTSDFSCYNLMRLHEKNCEYIPQQTKDDYSKLSHSYEEVYVKADVINNLNLFNKFSEYGCMSYLLLINSSDPTKKRLVKIRNGRLHHVESHTVYGVRHKNIEQQILIDSLLDDDVKIVVLSARQGCGKSFLGLACGLEQVVNKRKYSRILLAKSQASLSKDEQIGWLTGDIEDKLRYSMVNYTSNLEALGGGTGSSNKDGAMARKDGMKMFTELKARGQMDFVPLDSILGASYEHTYIIIDEAQSLDLKMIRCCLTRISDSAKIVIMGDIAQRTSVMHSIDKSGLYLANKYLRDVEGVSVVTLSEIERGTICRNVADALDKIEILG
ncbi:MAG: PhoH family protein [Cetobacterium sp.]